MERLKATAWNVWGCQQTGRMTRCVAQGACVFRGVTCAPEDGEVVAFDKDLEDVEVSGASAGASEQLGQDGANIGYVAHRLLRVQSAGKGCALGESRASALTIFKWAMHVMVKAEEENGMHW